MIRLDLTENINLVVQGPHVGIQDSRDPSAANDAHMLFRRNPMGESPDQLVALLWEILPGRRSPSGEFDPVVEAQLKYKTAAYGHKTLEGVATYGDGAQEDWRIAADTQAMRVEWIRQPHAHGASLIFCLRTARQCCNLEMWHTGRGRQIINGIMQGARGTDDAELNAQDETELLYYSIHPRNCLRAALSTGGDAMIRRLDQARVAEPGESADMPDEKMGMAEAVWEVEWVAHPSSLTYLHLSCGVSAAVAQFEGRQPLFASDASADFGPFYHQVMLSALPLNLVAGGEQLELRPNVLTADNQPERPIDVRELAWACEFLYLAEPQLTIRLLKETLERYMPPGLQEDPLWPAGLADNTIAELLMMAGRYFALTEDAEFAQTHLATWRACGRYLLSLRRPHEALPVTHRTWSPQGPLTGKDPYLAAMCYTAFVRLGFIETGIRNRAQGYQWQSEAETLREGALAPHQYGGLWNAEHHVFINYVDYSLEGQAQALAGPQEGVPRTGFALYQNVIPFWLGLAEAAAVVEGYRWIDGRWNYASGRAGLSYPPHIYGNFVALLDVCVRQRHGLAGADRLLQLILDHGYDGGLPFPEAPYGRYDFSAPNELGTPQPNWKHLPAGSLLANCVFLGLIYNVHYGLEYSKRGWFLGHPAPLSTYPISRVTRLRHERAMFSVTWQGRGKIRRVRLNGKTIRGQWLDKTEGQHEVVVELG